MKTTKGEINGVVVEIEHHPENIYSVDQNIYMINISEFIKERSENEPGEYIELYNGNMDEIMLEDGSQLKCFDVIGIGERLAKIDEKHYHIKNNIIYTLEYNMKDIGKISYIYRQGILEFLELMKKRQIEDESCIDRKDMSGTWNEWDDRNDTIYVHRETAKLLDYLGYYLKNGAHQ